MGICCLLLKNLALDCETWSWCKIDFLAKFHMTSCSSWEIVMKHHTSTPSHVLQGSVTVHPSINPSIYYCLYEFRLQGHQCNQRPVSNPHKTLKSYVSSCGWWAHRRTDLWSFFGLAFPTLGLIPRWDPCDSNPTTARRLQFIFARLH